MQKIPGLIATVLLLASPVAATAYPVTYSLSFLVDEFEPGRGVCSATPTGTSCVDPIGKLYTGYVVIDSSVLATDGRNQIGQLDALSIQMEDNIWAFNAPGNNSLVGFRGGAIGLGASSPGFDVLDGQLIGLEGGVFGASDAPFVDFLHPDPSSLTPDSYRFNAIGQPENFNDFSYVFEVQGVMTVSRVPEPATLAMLVVGLAGIGLQVRARKR